MNSLIETDNNKCSCVMFFLLQDSFGLPQKLVVFKLTSGSRVSIYVRKMVEDGSA